MYLIWLKFSLYCNSKFNVILPNPTLTIVLYPAPRLSTPGPVLRKWFCTRFHKQQHEIEHFSLLFNFHVTTFLNALIMFSSNEAIFRFFPARDCWHSVGEQLLYGNQTRALSCKDINTLDMLRSKLPFQIQFTETLQRSNSTDRCVVHILPLKWLITSVYLAIFKSEILFSELEIYSKGDIIIHCMEIIWNIWDRIFSFYRNSSWLYDLAIWSSVLWYLKCKLWLRKAVNIRYVNWIVE